MMNDYFKKLELFDIISELDNKQQMSITIMLIAGYTIKEIAENLNLTKFTIYHHIRKIKVHLKNAQ